MKWCCEFGDAGVCCLLGIADHRIGFYTFFSNFEIEAAGVYDEVLERLGRLVSMS